MGRLSLDNPIRNHKSAGFRLLITLLCGALGLLSLLGLFGISGFGRGFYAMLNNLMGEWAWLSPLIFMMLIVILNRAGSSLRKQTPRTNKRRSRSAVRKSRENVLPMKNPWIGDNKDNGEAQNEAFVLPKSKLVTLKGFEDYFAKPDCPDITDSVIIEEFKELGTDLKSYLNHGRDYPVYKPEKPLQSLQGLSAYFKENDLEPGKTPE